MPPPERFQADRKPELKKLISRVMEKQREVMKIDDHVKNFELPKTHMQLDDFVKRIQESGIVKDVDTIHRLFDALTVVPVMWFRLHLLYQGCARSEIIPLA
ncbi:hypothetical protein llap_21829 [Limosa lapponica baueri]|uniref:Uncharacterized protein n=1 Tax=Limosa lapponica baueri TaxID=1758121 RepID=A0A2I0T240_LIMLA|nr:hypothetical protein llap_21829 [Limosa lapponica baueri]